MLKDCNLPAGALKILSDALSVKGRNGSVTGVASSIPRFVPSVWSPAHNVPRPKIYGPIKRP